MRILAAMLMLAFFAAPARAENWALLLAAPTCADEAWPALRFAEQDIARLAELLERCGYDRKRIVRLSPRAARHDDKLAPTRENLFQRLGELASCTRQGDTLFIFLSGHGGERRVGNSMEPCYFPADGKPDDTATSAPLSQIVAKIEEHASAMKVVLVVDSCRTLPKNLGESSAGETRPATLPPRWSVLWSCSAGQSAYEDPRVQHGVFAHFLIEALRGSADASDDGRITFSELSEFVNESTNRHVAERLEKSQMPQVLTPADSTTSVEIVALPRED